MKLKAKKKSFHNGEKCFSDSFIWHTTCNSLYTVSEPKNIWQMLNIIKNWMKYTLSSELIRASASCWEWAFELILFIKDIKESMCLGVCRRTIVLGSNFPATNNQCFRYNAQWQEKCCLSNEKNNDAVICGLNYRALIAISVGSI